MAKQTELGIHIRNLRRAQGWSTAKLAEMAELSTGFINQLEKASRDFTPKPATLDKLAKAFNIDPVILYKLAGYYPISEFCPDEKIKSDIEKKVGQDWETIKSKKDLFIGKKCDDADWQRYLKSYFAQMDFKPEYIKEIIEFIEVVKIKQLIKEGKINIKD